MDEWEVVRDESLDDGEEICDRAAQELGESSVLVERVCEEGAPGLDEGWEGT